MPQATTDDLRIKDQKSLRSPAELIEEFPVSDAARDTVLRVRSDIHDILSCADDRVAVVVGPCSIHDPEAAVEYAQQLRTVAERLNDDLLVIMRVYFEKPRTTVGWKGLINDPNIDGSFEINKGLRIARKLLLDVNDQGIPAGVEYLDLISPQYIADLVGWGAIGARTTESQGHRELASGLSCPVGFKNGTAGSVQIAVDAIGVAKHSHHFLSVAKDGRSTIFETSGNEDCHLILRGGSGNTNYDAASVDDAAAACEKSGVPARIMIDCSHANSRKQHTRQSYVCQDICYQIAHGDRRIIGVMIESNLIEGKQSEPAVRGQSITDACIGWDETVGLLEQIAEAVRGRRGAHVV